jgi:uncharacterized protein YsxB (DUF464 family)
LIEIKVSEKGIRMHGHAGQGKCGQDIVCSAVSALTCNLINSLEHLTVDQIRADTGNGKTVIEWHRLSDQGRILVDSWFLGIAAINQEYNCITFV